jgi:alpha-galactosidase
MLNPTITLHGDDCSLVIECPENAPPLWRYWGPRLSDDYVSGPTLMETRPTPSFSLDETVPFSIFPTFGMGWFGQSALLAHRAGQDFTQAIMRTDVVRLEAENAVRFCLFDDVAQIELTVSMALNDNVLTISTSLTNRGDGVLDVQWLAAAVLPLPANAAKAHSFTGRHNSEFVQQTDALARAIWRKENRRGLTSHDAFPGALIDADGVSYAAQLAWSGNHVQSIEWLDDGRYQWQLGEWLSPGEVLLPRGATITTPDVLATCSHKGTDDIAQNFHAAIRTRMTWPGGSMTPRPVHLNTWEGYYFNHDLPSLIKLADAAAEVGIERFVLDDGWFHRRDDDSKALGDWWPDIDKYPKGLAPLADHVVAKGMEFGLWVEPEMVNPDSELFAAHPEWAMQLAGRPLLTARNQLVLDLSRPEVGDYLFGCIAKLLEDLPISYLKWDHNRDLAPAGGVGGTAAYRKQVLAAYALLDRFRSAFPNVEIEACAGGGGRIDAGIVRHSHRFWTSDCIDAVSRAQMQPGFLQYMPPETMGAHIGAAPAHSTGRSQSLDFRAAVAMQGHLGVEFDLVKLSTEERTRLAAWIAFYKDWRRLLHGKIWTGKAGDAMIWHAAGDANEWLVFVFRMEPMSYRHMPQLRLPFATRGERYEISEIGPGVTGSKLVYDGSWLNEAGMAVPPMNAQSATIYHGKRQ